MNSRMERFTYHPLLVVYKFMNGEVYLSSLLIVYEFINGEVYLSSFTCSL